MLAILLDEEEKNAVVLYRGGGVLSFQRAQKFIPGQELITGKTQKRTRRFSTISIKKRQLELVAAEPIAASKRDRSEGVDAAK